MHSYLEVHLGNFVVLFISSIAYGIIMHYLMLPVIIWSPIEQYADLISSECPKCRMDGLSSQIIPTVWTDALQSAYHG